MRCGRHRGLILVLVGGLAGCWAGNGLTLGRVRGKVTVDGMPAPAGFVTFHPDSEKQTMGNPAMSTISADGTYDLSTQDPGDGAIVGSHKVTIVVYDPEPIGDRPAIDPEEAPEKFLATKGQKGRGRSQGATKARTGPSKAGAEGRTIQGRGGQSFRVLVPEALGNPATSGIAVQVERGSNALNFDIQEDGSVKVH